MAVFGRLSGWRITRTGIVFIVGIIVLGGLVTGGIFIVKNHGEVVRHDRAVKVAEQNLKDQSQTATQPTNTSGSGSSTGTTSTNAPSAGAAAAPDTTAAANPSASQLPVTGIDPIATLETAGILAIVAFSMTSLIVSRRTAHHL